MYYRDAREFFEAAREASRDAERIRRQLDAMAERAEALGGGGFEPRVRSTGEPDRMGSRVAAMVDRERELAKRQAEDYEIIAEELHLDGHQELMRYLQVLADVGLVQMPGDGTVWSERMLGNAEYFGKLRANGKRGGRPRKDV